MLVSTHPPVVAHLAALALKRQTGRPWIADFRDPLRGNPSRAALRAAQIDQATEWLVVHETDAVIADTEASAVALARDGLHGKPLGGCGVRRSLHLRNDPTRAWDGCQGAVGRLRDQRL